jgi:hypothetical protein
MASTQSPRGWAVITIFLGFVISYPFLRKTSVEPAGDPTASLATTSQVARQTSKTYIADSQRDGAIGPSISMTSQQVTSSDASSQFVHPSQTQVETGRANCPRPTSDDCADRSTELARYPNLGQSSFDGRSARRSRAVHQESGKFRRSDSCVRKRLTTSQPGLDL